MQIVLNILSHRKLTPAWLSKRLDVNRATVHHWTTGKNGIPYKQRMNIALLLDLPLDMLFPEERNQIKD